jgi:hypothetical protein
MVITYQANAWFGPSAGPELAKAPISEEVEERRLRPELARDSVTRLETHEEFRDDHQ